MYPLTYFTPYKRCTSSHIMQWLSMVESSILIWGISLEQNSWPTLKTVLFWYQYIVMQSMSSNCCLLFNIVTGYLFFFQNCVWPKISHTIITAMIKIQLHFLSVCSTFSDLSIIIRLFSTFITLIYISVWCSSHTEMDRINRLLIFAYIYLYLALMEEL